MWPSSNSQFFFSFLVLSDVALVLNQSPIIPKFLTFRSMKKRKVLRLMSRPKIAMLFGENGRLQVLCGNFHRRRNLNANAAWLGDHLYQISSSLRENKIELIWHYCALKESYKDPKFQTDKFQLWLSPVFWLNWALGLPGHKTRWKTFLRAKLWVHFVDVLVVPEHTFSQNIMTYIYIYIYSRFLSGWRPFQFFMTSSWTPWTTPWPLTHTKWRNLEMMWMVGKTEGSLD